MMSNAANRWVLRVLFCGAIGWAIAVDAAAPAQDATYMSATGTSLRILLDQQKLGTSEIELGEITIPAGADSGDHAHGATEIFYVLSGELEHVVNGKSELLGPGMVGFVRPPDQVRHKVPGKVPAKAVVIWTPGGEAGRITARWKRQGGDRW